MKGRTTLLVAAAAVAVAFAVAAVGCSDDDGRGSGDQSAPPSTASDPDTERAIVVVADDLVATPRADYRSEDEPLCVAEQVVTRIGLARLAEVGLDVETGTPPQLWKPELTDAEGEELVAAYDHCLDFEQRDIDGFMADDGLTEDQARCVSRAYRASGIPQAHSLERPHGSPGDLTPERLAAHEDLDVFLTAAKDACRDWIRE